MKTPNDNRCRGCGEPSEATYCEICSTQVIEKGFTRAELSRAFDAVKDPANWKMPIDKTLGKLTEAEKDVIHAAVIFYAGCEPTFTDQGGLCGVEFTRVQAPGYYNAVGA